jgi:hypothetical protein
MRTLILVIGGVLLVGSAAAEDPPRALWQYHPLAAKDDPGQPGQSNPDAAIKPQPQTACFDVVANPHESGASMVMIDKCTGRTWMLTRIFHVDAKGNSTGTSYRWSPILADDQEAILSQHAYPATR